MRKVKKLNLFSFFTYYNLSIYRDFGKFCVDSELLHYSGCCNSQPVTQTHWELCLIYERFPLCAQPYPISIIPPNLMYTIRCSGWSRVLYMRGLLHLIHYSGSFIQRFRKGKKCTFLVGLTKRGGGSF